jgi:hypothetical protein
MTQARPKGASTGRLLWDQLVDRVPGREVVGHDRVDGRMHRVEERRLAGRGLDGERCPSRQEADHRGAGRSRGVRGDPEPLLLVGSSRVPSDRLDDQRMIKPCDAGASDTGLWVMGPAGSGPTLALGPPSCATAGRTDHRSLWGGAVVAPFGDGRWASWSLSAHVHLSGVRCPGPVPGYARHRAGRNLRRSTDEPTQLSRWNWAGDGTPAAGSRPAGLGAGEGWRTGRHGEGAVMGGLTILAVVVVAYTLVASRLDRWWITGPMVFVAAGVILGPGGLDVLPLSLNDETVLTITELTLALLLFADASTVRLRDVEGDTGLPGGCFAIHATAFPPSRARCAGSSGSRTATRRRRAGAGGRGGTSRDRRENSSHGVREASVRCRRSPRGAGR